MYTVGAGTYCLNRKILNQEGGYDVWEAQLTWRDQNIIPKPLCTTSILGRLTPCNTLEIFVQKPGITDAWIYLEQTNAHF